jgi:thermitase
MSTATEPRWPGRQRWWGTTARAARAWPMAPRSCRCAFPRRRLRLRQHHVAGPLLGGGQWRPVANISFSGVPGNSTVQSAAAYMRSKGGVRGGRRRQQRRAGKRRRSRLHPGNIAATDRTMRAPAGLSYGPYVDVSAPGVSIYSAWSGGGYGNVPALPSPAPSPPQPRAGDVGQHQAHPGRCRQDPHLHCGRPRQRRAMTSISARPGRRRPGRSCRQNHVRRPPPPTPRHRPSASPSRPAAAVSGVVAVDVNYSDNVGVTRAELYVNGSKVADGRHQSLCLRLGYGDYADGSYSLVAKAYDAAGNIGTRPRFP